jgi:hypothetical protein
MSIYFIIEVNGLFPTLKKYGRLEKSGVEIENLAHQQKVLVISSSL